VLENADFGDIIGTETPKKGDKSGTNTPKVPIFTKRVAERQNSETGDNQDKVLYFDQSFELSPLKEIPLEIAQEAVQVASENTQTLASLQQEAGAMLAKIDALNGELKRARSNRQKNKTRNNEPLVVRYAKEISDLDTQRTELEKQLFAVNLQIKGLSQKTKPAF
jgi:hypothetical protein